MAQEIARIESLVYETTGTPGPRVLHDLAAFEILGTPCHARTDAAGDGLYLRIGTRDFALSLLDLAGTAAIAIEGHLRGEIRARVLASMRPTRGPAPVAATMPTPVPSPAPAPTVVIPIRGAVEADGFITLHPAPGRPRADR